MTFFERARQRKVGQWILGYLAGAWVCLQVLDFFGGHFHWSDRVVPAATAFLAIGFLAVLVLAWRHGERGRQQVSRPEVLLLITILLVATAGAVVVARAGTGVTAHAVATADISIAVLPFLNLSDSKENEYFSDGITEDVLTNLSKIGSLRVISRTSVMRYKGTDKAVPIIAGELGVSHVLEGSVRRAGDQVRITAQLIRAGQEQHLWADSYDRKLADIFAVQTEIARAIADALAAHLSPRETARIAARPTESLEAYDRFLQGRERYFRIDVKSDVEAAISLLREAVALDSEFGLAWAYLARSFSFRTRWRGGLGDDIAWGDSALVTARRAIAVLPDAPDGYSALGESYRGAGRFEEALEQYRRALAIDPNHSLSLAEVGETYSSSGLGNMVESIRWLTRAISIDPSQGWMYEKISGNYRVLDEYDAAAQWLERGLRTAHYGRDDIRDAYIILEVYRGDWVAAKRRMDAKLAETGDGQRDPVQAAVLSFRYGNETLARSYAKTVSDPRHRQHGHLLWLEGDRAGAARLIEANVFERNTRQRLRLGRPVAPLVGITLANWAALRGDTAATLEDIEHYVAHGGSDYAQLTRNPLFASVRTEPRFVAALARLRAELDRQRSALRKARL